jgi:hypothetical protein
MNNVSKKLGVCQAYDLDDSDELAVDKEDTIITEAERETHTHTNRKLMNQYISMSHICLRRIFEKGKSMN